MVAKNLHIKWISSLKGVSCFCIFLGHFFYAFANENVFWAGIIYSKLMPFVFNGVFVVSLFAFVSGYFISSKRNVLDSFVCIAKRYFRFCLPLFVIMFFIWLLNYFISYSENAEKAVKLFNNAWISSNVTSDLSFTDVLFESTTGVILLGSNKFSLPTWIIRPMFFSYAMIIIWNLFLLRNSKLESFLLRFKRVDLLLLGGGLSVINYVFLAVILGYWFKIVFQKSFCYKYANKHFKKYCIFLSIMILVLGHIVQSFSIYIPIYLFRLVMVLLAAVLFAILSLAPLKVLENDVGDKIGNLSFPIYLIHMPVIHVVSTGVIMYMVESAHVNLSASVFVSFVVSIIMVVLLSAIWNSTVDKIIDRINKRIFLIKT